MKILLVNDDGYRAQGIIALGRALISRGHEVTVCAPDRERSAAGHSISISTPLRAKEFSEDGLTGWKVDGTPADCARLGIFLMENNVDMVISGINHGHNMGGACVYSGTVAGAKEAAMRGCQAIAASLDTFGPPDFTAAAEITAKVAHWAYENPLPMGEFYNLNIPNLPYEEIKGVKSATLAPVFLGGALYEKRRAPKGSDYYWLIDGPDALPHAGDSDFTLCKSGWATISRLTWNMLAGEKISDPEVKL